MKEVTCIPHYHNQQCVTLKVTVKSKLCTPEPLVPDVPQHDRTVLLIEKNNASMRRNNQMTPWNAVSTESILCVYLTIYVLHLHADMVCTSGFLCLGTCNHKHKIFHHVVPICFDTDWDDSRVFIQPHDPHGHKDEIWFPQWLFAGQSLCK